MKCPKCNGLNITPQGQSVPIDRPGGPWRHYHGLCCDCGQALWWSAHPGDADAILKEGPHDCAFFRTDTESA
jgi:hypothetical protein